MPIINTIEGAIAIGILLGLGAYLLLGRWQFGCLSLLGIPVAMFVYVQWWQSQHPESLRSTSALDFFFGPLWPSLGGALGYFLIPLIRDARKKN